MIRVGRALGPSHYRYWHPTSTAGAFGAAAAGASVLGLDAQATAHALGNAGSRTGGLWQMRHEPVPTKSLHNAEAARSGWLAARLAARGVAGPLAILEGPQGLFAATAAQADADQVSRDAPGWAIEEVSFKPWPACRHAHPAIDALRRALGKGVEPQRIRRMRIETYADALRFCDKPTPRTEMEAKFSLQHCAALVALFEQPRLADFLPERLDRAEIAALRGRTEVAEDVELSALFPRHYGARAIVTLDDGHRLEAEVRDAWGDPEWPLDDAALADKAFALMHWGGLSAGTAARLVDVSLGLARGTTLAEFGAALREAA
jgi:2-methylcitrate dehydratase PrpD